MLEAIFDLFNCIYQSSVESSNSKKKDIKSFVTTYKKTVILNFDWLNFSCNINNGKPALILILFKIDMNLFSTFNP